MLEVILYCFERISLSLVSNLAAEWRLIAVLASGLLMDVQRKSGLEERYRTANFRTDVGCAAFDFAPKPQFLILVLLGTIVAEWLRASASLMEIEAVALLSLWLPLVLLFVLQNVGVCWRHHLQHSSAIFWPLKRVFFSPSFDEEHQSTSPEYRDTNLGGALVIWDRLFASYAEQSAKNLEHGLVEERVPKSYVGQSFVLVKGLHPREFGRSPPCTPENTEIKEQAA